MRGRVGLGLRKIKNSYIMSTWNGPLYIVVVLIIYPVSHDTRTLKVQVKT